MNILPCNTKTVYIEPRHFSNIIIIRQETNFVRNYVKATALTKTVLF